MEGPFDAVIAADNVLDGFEDSDRRRVLGEIGGLLERRASTDEAPGCITWPVTASMGRASWRFETIVRW